MKVILEYDFAINGRAVVAFRGMVEPYCVVKVVGIHYDPVNRSGSCEAYLSLYKKSVTIKQTITGFSMIEFTLMRRLVQVHCENVSENLVKLRFMADDDNIEARVLRKTH